MADGGKSTEEGYVVWYRPEMDTGVVVLRSGRQYRFSEMDGLDLVKARQIVMVDVVAGQPAQVTLRPLLTGDLLFEPEPEPPKKPARKSRAKAGTTTKKATAASKAKTTKRKTTGVANKLKPKRDGSLPEGLPVLHPQHGQGFVVVSSAKVARVRFMPHEAERSVRVEDLQVLDTV